MKQLLKYILLLLVFLGALQQSIAAPSTISSSVALTQTALNEYNWPVSITGGSAGSPIIVTLAENVILSNAQNYFIIKGDYITFQGNNYTITISGVPNYLGLINNGGPTVNGFNNLSIQNLGVLAVNSTTIEVGQGWIGQRYFSKNATNNLVSNCYSTGSIPREGGGILGSNSSGTAIKCYSTGIIQGGGIFGSFASFGTATNCYSTGSIDQFGGGIFSIYTSFGTATNCYSTGSIGMYGGGIFSYYTSNSTATNCYSTGSIGMFGGGIFSLYTSNSKTTNCYSTGTIASYAGGLFGYSSNLCEANNCYSAGSIGMYGGGIFSSYTSNSTATYCYEANGNFNTTTANSNLIGTNGNVWNTTFAPYRLIVFFPPLKWGLSPYGLKTQDSTIQLDKYGKKGTSTPVNENGKMN
jgi:hypothetical protein